MCESYCCEFMRESCSARTKLALGDLEKAKSIRVTIFFVIDRKQFFKYQTYSEETGREETLRGDLELEG